MKKFQVKNAVLTKEQIIGNEPYDLNITDDYVGDYIVAENAEKAIEFAIDYLVEQIRQNSHYDVDVADNTITVYDDDTKIQKYCNFTANEI